MEKLTIDKQVILDLAKQISELNDKMESLELMSDEGFMKSHKESKEQIKKREFGNWDEL